MMDIEEVERIPDTCPDCGDKIILRRTKTYMLKQARLLLLTACCLTLGLGWLVVWFILWIMVKKIHMPLLGYGLLLGIALIPGSAIASRALRMPKVRIVKCQHCGAVGKYIRQRGANAI